MTEDQQKQLLRELLEKQKNGTLKPADRYKILPQPMPAQEPNKRNKNVNEVTLGYTETQAQLEAMRCLRAGRTESHVMPLDESVAIAETMDRVRSQIGLRYPVE